MVLFYISKVTLPLFTLLFILLISIRHKKNEAASLLIFIIFERSIKLFSIKVFKAGNNNLYLLIVLKITCIKDTLTENYISANRPLLRKNM